MIYVVGIGNYGKEYSGTRHNVGFEVVNRLIEKTKPLKKKDHWLYDIDDMELMKPRTFVNHTGQAICSARWREKEIVVVHDDLDLEVGTMKLKYSGGDGGHNGLKSIIGVIGQNFARVRIGIGRPVGLAENYVLEPFSKEERPAIDSAIDRAVLAIKHIAQSEIESAMTIYNRRNI